MTHATEKRKEGYVSFKRIILGIVPILVAIALNIIGLWLPFALFIGISTVFLIKRNRIRDFPVIVWRGLNKWLLVTTFSIMIFRGVVEGTQAFNEIFITLQYLGVLPIFFFTVFPFLIGLVTAIPTSAIAIVFPLVLPLFPNITLPMISLMYQSIFIGYAISPIHLCLILTTEYYKSKVQSVYRLWGPMVLVAYLFSIVVAILIASFV